MSRLAVISDVGFLGNKCINRTLVDCNTQTRFVLTAEIASSLGGNSNEHVNPGLFHRKLKIDLRR